MTARAYEPIPFEDGLDYPVAEMLARAEAFRSDITRRRTIRSFSDRPVDRRIIEDCIAAAGSAPSGANHQPWHFTVIGDPAVKRRVREAAEVEERAFYGDKAASEWIDALRPLGTDAEKPYLEIAPWLIVIFGQRRGGAYPGDDMKNYYIHESVGIATGILISALHHSGLATLTHTPNPMSFLTKLCGRPASEKPYLILVAGHPAPGATIPRHSLVKKPLSQISNWL